jgi:hypothetical protein
MPKVMPPKNDAALAVITLRRFALLSWDIFDRASTVSEPDISGDEVRSAIGALLDHVTRLEQTIELISGGVASALRNRPDNATIAQSSHPISLRAGRKR